MEVILLKRYLQRKFSSKTSPGNQQNSSYLGSFIKVFNLEGKLALELWEIEGEWQKIRAIEVRIIKVPLYIIITIAIFVQFIEEQSKTYTVTLNDVSLFIA